MSATGKQGKSLKDSGYRKDYNAEWRVISYLRYFAPGGLNPTDTNLARHLSAVLPRVIGVNSQPTIKEKGYSDGTLSAGVRAAEAHGYVATVRGNGTGVYRAIALTEKGKNTILPVWAEGEMKYARDYAAARPLPFVAATPEPETEAEPTVVEATADITSIEADVDMRELADRVLLTCFEVMTGDSLKTENERLQAQVASLEGEVASLKADNSKLLRKVGGITAPSGLLDRLRA